MSIRKHGSPTSSPASPTTPSAASTNCCLLTGNPAQQLSLPARLRRGPHRMATLEHHDLELHHRVERRPSALVAWPAPQRRRQRPAEQLEIHHLRQPFQRVTSRLKRRVAIAQIGEARLTNHFRLHRSTPRWNHLTPPISTGFEPPYFKAVGTNHFLLHGRWNSFTNKVRSQTIREDLPARPNRRVLQGWRVYPHMHRAEC